MWFLTLLIFILKKLKIKNSLSLLVRLDVRFLKFTRNIRLFAHFAPLTGGIISTRLQAVHQVFLQLISSSIMDYLRT